MTNLFVCILIPCLKRGGTEMQTLRLVEALRSFDHKVIVICYFEYEDSMVQEFKDTGAIVNLLDLNRRLGFFKIICILKKEIRSAKPDVVHVQYMAPGALPIIAARLAGVKTVFATIHQPWTHSYGIISKLILRNSALLCTRFIAVSVNAEKSWFGSGQLFDANKPVKMQPRHLTIYNSVDTQKIKGISLLVNADQIKHSLGLVDDNVVIGVISRLRNEKGIDLLIEAFSQLVEEGVSVHLLIVGTGPDEANLKEMVHELGVKSHVTFYGATDWMTAMKLMGIMEIVVVPSRFEGFGLTAAEAMAAGKPVIASDCFGLKEIVQNEQTGLLFKTGDKISLMQTLYILLKDPELVQKLKENGEKNVENNFSKEIFGLKIRHLYNSFS
jgi:L-malate glycosyltransferase